MFSFYQSHVPACYLADERRTEIVHDAPTRGDERPPGQAQTPVRIESTRNHIRPSPCFLDGIKSPAVTAGASFSNVVPLLRAGRVQPTPKPASNSLPLITTCQRPLISCAPPPCRESERAENGGVHDRKGPESHVARLRATFHRVAPVDRAT